MDYTKIILAVIALINAVLTTFLIPWLKKKTDAEELKKWQTYVDIAVKAADQLFKSDEGMAKKAYVQHYLAEKGIKYDADTVDKMIESAVLFQFAPPRGGDPSGAAAATTASYFNSHPRVGVTRGHSSSRLGSLFQFALQQRRRYRHFSKANNGINVQCWNAQFFHISDSDADVLVPAKEIAVRGENIEGIEQFFHSEASSMMPAASCRSRSR